MMCGRGPVITTIEESVCDGLAIMARGNLQVLSMTLKEDDFEHFKSELDHRVVNPEATSFLYHSAYGPVKIIKTGDIPE